MKITSLEESADFATPDTEKLFSKLKSHELSRKGHLNHNASLTSKTLITSARVGVHNANPTNTTVSSALEFALSSLAVASNGQYESIPDDEITLLVRKFRALHKFCNERMRSLRDCFECGDTTQQSPTTSRGRSSTPPTSITITTTIRMIPTTRATTRRSTTSKMRRRRRRRRSSRKSCPERMLP
jgi:hypothetical protein